MPTYEHSIVIERPIDVVYRNATCLKGCINWQTSVLHAEQVSDSPVGVGTRYKHTLKFMGLTDQTEPEVTVYNPPHAFAYKDPDAPVSFETFYTFDEVPGGTQVNVRIESDLSQSFLGKLALPMFLKALRRQFDSDMAMLKEMLEDGHTVHAQ